jgi:predicted membrane channel-forming protein YqfA (hemolysin III family)
MPAFRFLIALPWLLAGDVCHEVGCVLYGRWIPRSTR